MRTGIQKSSLARRGLTALAGLAVVAGTLVGIAVPASAAISNASINPSSWTPSQQAAVTVTWTESSFTTNLAAFNDSNPASGGDYVSVEVGWGWVLAGANPTATPVAYTATWDPTAKSYTCATIGTVFASTGFSNTTTGSQPTSGAQCLVRRSSAGSSNPGQQVVLANIGGGSNFNFSGPASISVTFPAGTVTAPSVAPAQDTWRIISLTSYQTTTVTTVVPGVDAAGNTVELITLDLDSNGGTCSTSKVTGIMGSWGKAPKWNDCSRPGYTYASYNTSPDGSGIAIAPEGNIHFTGDNRVYVQWFDPTAPVVASEPPVNVVATGKWNRVQVNWDAPAKTGTYPITNYLVTASPSSQVCITRLIDKKLTQCSFNKIVPGTSYTFTVRALTGAGWSERSVVSNVASPFNLQVTKFDRSKVLFGLAGTKVKLDLITPGYAPGVKITPMVSYDKGAKWSKMSGDSFNTAAAIARFPSLKFGRNYNNTAISVKFVDPEGNESNSVNIPPAK